MQILDLESIVGSQRLELAESHKKAELLEAQVKEAQERLESFNNLDQSVDDSTSILQVLFYYYFYRSVECVVEGAVWSVLGKVLCGVCW